MCGCVVVWHEMRDRMGDKQSSVTSVEGGGGGGGGTLEVVIDGCITTHRMGEEVLTCLGPYPIWFLPFLYRVGR